jgi:NAD(P)H dehydrogenase (quinone)
MSIVVTGATGHLGRLVVRDLLERGLPAGQVVAGARRPQDLTDLADRGVRVARVDYDDSASLAAAFAGADKVLIVSGTDLGRRAGQHAAAATAARAAGAGLIVYTSAPHADTTPMRLAEEHLASERAIAALGTPYAFLRNSWYFENYTAQIPTYLERGAVLGAAGAGRISGAARADYAAAAAAVLATDGHYNAVYELGGDTAFTLAELADLVAGYSGKPVVYRDLPTAEYAGALEAAGMPAPVAATFADVDQAIRGGALLVETGDLSRLIGRPTSTLAAAVEAACADGPAPAIARQRGAPPYRPVAVPAGVVDQARQNRSAWTCGRGTRR